MLNHSVFHHRHRSWNPTGRMTAFLGSAAIAAAIAVFALGGGIGFNAAHAQTTGTDANTASSSMDTSTPSGTNATGTNAEGTLMSGQFTRNLKIGDTGNDVLALQQLLNANGFPLAMSGPGSPGNETTYFGTLTRAALARWQASEGITPSAGYFGPVSRQAINTMTSSSAPANGSSTLNTGGNGMNGSSSNGSNGSMNGNGTNGSSSSATPATPLY